jgi:hypothetical protein
MNFFKSMDLYKGIILMSVLLLPAGGWWVSKLQTEIQECETALRDSTKPGGYLEEIGALQKKIEVVAQNRRTTSNAIESPSIYFQGQIMSVSPDLKANDFAPGKSVPENATIGKQRVLDHVVDIKWGDSRNRSKVRMDFVYAVLFNCESGARKGMGADGSPSVWRLRSLNIQNASSDAWLGRKKTPEPEMEDGWYIKEMKFARREPRTN